MSSGGVLKSINRYLVQAKKVDKVDPVVAYYCRLHAAQVALKTRKSKEDEAVAEELISWCEKVSHSHTSNTPTPQLLHPSSPHFAHPLPGPSPSQRKSVIAGLSRDDGRLRVETFALEVFASADAEDRSGSITGKTATAFFAAYVFMDVCHQFGELASDVAQKMKYAAWKATEINKALKEGRQPKPGGMEEEGMDGMDFGGSGGGDGMAGAAAEDGMRGGRGTGSGGGGAGVGGGPGRPAAVGGGGGGFVPGGRDDGVGAERAAPAAAAAKVSWKEDEDELMAARYAATLPSVSSPPPSASAPHLTDSDDEKAAPPAFNPSSVLPMQPQQPAFPVSYLPSNYLPSAQPPPLPPQPSSRDTANAFGFSVEGSSSPASSAPYSPGFTGPALPRHSLPSPQPALPPPVQAPPPSSSLSSSSPRYSPAPPSLIPPTALAPVLGKTRSQASKEAERLLKHASSALSFDDVDTTVVKLQQAVALLYPHRTSQ